MMPLHELLPLVARATAGERAGAGAAPSSRSSAGFGGAQEGRPLSSYARLLLAMDRAVSAEVDACLARLQHLSEPLVARQLSRWLPRGHGLFLGNSMPIRCARACKGLRIEWGVWGAGLP
jgi:2-succinyl-5-enolpyruvyl-6-hydroxy-3-cyclohexene-1-carboxylate synthase